MCPFRKITLQRIPPQDYGPQVRWHQTAAAQSSIIFPPIILKIVFIVLQISDEISVKLMAAMGFKWNPLWH